MFALFWVGNRRVGAIPILCLLSRDGDRPILPSPVSYLCSPPQNVVGLSPISQRETGCSFERFPQLLPPCTVGLVGSDCLFRTVTSWEWPWALGVNNNAEEWAPLSLNHLNICVVAVRCHVSREAHPSDPVISVSPCPFPSRSLLLTKIEIPGNLETFKPCFWQEFFFSFPVQGGFRFLAVPRFRRAVWFATWARVCGCQKRNTPVPSWCNS